jgi:hypothetical protein
MNDSKDFREIVRAVKVMSFVMACLMITKWFILQ